MTVNWSKARKQRGGPAGRSAARLDRVRRSLDRSCQWIDAGTACGRKHVELHGRLAEGSALDHPVIETVLQIAGGSVQGLHPLLTQPFDADVRTMLSGLQDFSPNPGRSGSVKSRPPAAMSRSCKSRIQQGDLIAVAAARWVLPPMAVSMANCR